MSSRERKTEISHGESREPVGKEHDEKEILFKKQVTTFFLVCACAMANIWRSENNLKDSVLSSHHHGAPAWREVYNMQKPVASFHFLVLGIELRSPGLTAGTFIH